MKTKTKILHGYDSKIINGKVYFEDKFVQNAMDEHNLNYEREVTKLRKALKEIIKVAGTSTLQYHIAKEALNDN